jgi:CO dehydrogenase maturation factor
MKFSIAMAGKGGVGKTTVCGMLIDHLARLGKRPVLAVDADANANLYEVLGVEEPLSLGALREEIARAEMQDPSPIPAGMSKREYADYRFGQALVEGDDYDLLAMGRPQGKGCYCYVNDILREQLNKYYKSYDYLVVDNEAGLEHISRGILPPVDLILLVSDCSRRGIQAAGRINAMIGELDLKVKDCRLIVNRAPSRVLDAGIGEEIERQNLKLLGVLPTDDSIYQYDVAGKPLVTLSETTPLRAALKELILKLNVP